ncbi:MAG: peptidylprolyl isomerase [bacterium]
MTKVEMILGNGSKLEIELYEEQAPNTVKNFVDLINKGYYDGLTFHRVIAGFVSQGGCPIGNGTGGPGYKINCELINNPLIHELGSLSMAHAGPNTGGSQFFICHGALPHLDGRHTVFGKVVSGVDAAVNMSQGETMASVKVVG